METNSKTDKNYKEFNQKIRLQTLERDLITKNTRKDLFPIGRLENINTTEVNEMLEKVIEHNGFKNVKFIHTDKDATIDYVEIDEEGRLNLYVLCSDISDEVKHYKEVLNGFSRYIKNHFAIGKAFLVAVNDIGDNYTIHSVKTTREIINYL